MGAEWILSADLLDPVVVFSEEVLPRDSKETNDRERWKMMSVSLSVRGVSSNLQFLVMLTAAHHKLGCAVSFVLQWEGCFQ